VDGSPQTPDCDLDLRHAGDVYTRYCHMLTRPAVNEGQVVTAGQVIGVVGSSGHSSGPHLHFEVHRSDGAIDPVAFMATRAPLGRPLSNVQDHTYSSGSR
jgi:murein DD-endopeptidase MepM/ murein hydrolase activator NlpD